MRPTVGDYVVIVRARDLYDGRIGKIVADDMSSQPYQIEGFVNAKGELGWYRPNEVQPTQETWQLGSYYPSLSSNDKIETKNCTVAEAKKYATELRCVGFTYNPKQGTASFFECAGTRFNKNPWDNWYWYEAVQANGRCDEPLELYMMGLSIPRNLRKA